MKGLFKALLLLLLLFNLQIAHAQQKSETIEIKKIWDRAPHNAYTDITFFKGKFYVVFREGEDGDSSIGKIRILASQDGEFWESAGLLEMNGVDLRDPKITQTPKKRLLILFGGLQREGDQIASTTTYYSLSDPSGAKFAEPEPVELDERITGDHNWLWRITWYGKTGFGVVFQSHVDGDPQSSRALLVRTGKGDEVELVSELDIPGNPREATVRFLTGSEMAILVKREGDQPAMMGTSKEPYSDWTWEETDLQLTGPNFEVIPINKILIGLRMQDDNGAYTALIMRKKGEPYKEVMRLPSGGDTGYPGFFSIAGYIWMTYYASHEGKASIYYVQIPYEKLQSANQ